ncbi:hypothetical protein CgunFtcFv8_011789 [Champsocephalus gunnari]|uniref:Uncharacterized protein n=1 Tax=Champsocephalus gunnari TaxID=52237 RepID=A0AAN8D5M7_CHAGU|nr:hypothetical protein CgunFtcFv8_011789 [Champsocephalus gunnari]
MIDSPRLAREESRAGASPGRLLPAALPWHQHSVTSQVMEPPCPPPSESPISCLQQAAAISTGPDWTWAGERRTL